jgi:hypothetical protein
MIIYYCISPHCKNKCGNKKPSEEEMREERKKFWRAPCSYPSLLYCETKFCDDEGNVVLPLKGD